MSSSTNISWTDATWNPIAGCKPVSAGCVNCYAAQMAYRLECMGQKKYEGLTKAKRNGCNEFNGRLNLCHDALSIPLRWKKPRRIFVNSMSDLFHEDVPFEFIDEVYAVMLACAYFHDYDHTFQILTKRPKRMAEYYRSRTPAEHLQAWAKAGHIRIQVGDGDESFSDAIEWHCRHHWNEKWVAKDDPGPWGAVDNLFPLSNVWLGTSVENQKAADERIGHLVDCPAAVRFLSCEPLLSGLT